MLPLPVQTLYEWFHSTQHTILTHSLALTTFVLSSLFSFVKYFLSLFCVTLFHTQSVPFIHRFVLLLFVVTPFELPCLHCLCASAPGKRTSDSFLFGDNLYLLLISLKLGGSDRRTRTLFFLVQLSIISNDLYNFDSRTDQRIKRPNLFDFTNTLFLSASLYHYRHTLHNAV